MPDRAVGGEFELGLSPDGLHRPEDVRRFWTSRLPGSNTMASTGRAALTLILAAVKREDRQRHTFLLPAYLCGSILEPFRGAGVRARFYAVDQNLRVDVDALVRAAHQPDVSGVLFINYFGLPADPELREALSGLRKRRWIIEDCAAGGMLETGGDPIGATGHFAFTSLRKFLPVPDEAVIRNRYTARLRTGRLRTIPVGCDSARSGSFCAESTRRSCWRRRWPKRRSVVSWLCFRSARPDGRRDGTVALFAPARAGRLHALRGTEAS